MKKGLIYALISGAAYGSLSVLGKMGLQTGTAPSELLGYRFGIAALVLFAILALTDFDLVKPARSTIIKGLILGFCFYGLQSMLFFHALLYIPASTATLIIYFYPLTVTLLSMVFFRMKATRGVYASLFLILAGCAMVFYDAFVKGLSIYGVGLAVASMMGFSIYLITAQFFLKGEHPLRITLYALLATALFFMLFHNPLKILTLNGRQFAIVLGLALFPTVLAVSLLYKAIEKIGSAYTSIFSTLEPIVTVILAACILGEEIAAVQILGMSLIIAGILIPNLEYLAAARCGRLNTGLDGQRNERERVDRASDRRARSV
jgi:drug/metabolite transporter (DMT)-like permease